MTDTVSTKVTRLDKVLVKSGRIIEVMNENRKKFSKAAKTYLTIQVEDANGGNERCLLFTAREMRVAEERAKKNPEDWTKKNILVDAID